MAAVRAPNGGYPLTTQRWDDLTFVHWPVEPDAVEPLFPPGVRPDLFEGRTYVALVPFEMNRAGPGRLPTPYFGRFCETNVRLYSVDDRGRHGIVFLTLDATRLATVLLARLALGLPYAWSAMTAERTDDVVTYTSRRRWPDARTAGGGRIAVRIKDPIEPTPLEHWLTARFGLHTRIARRTVWIPNHHDAWPLYEAELVGGLDCDFVAGCGVSVDDTQLMRPLWSPGVETAFGLPARL